LKVNGTYQLLVYADHVNVLGGSVHTVEKNTETLVVLVRRLDEKKMLITLSILSCLEIRMQDEVTVRRQGG